MKQKLYLIPLLMFVLASCIPLIPSARAELTVTRGIIFPVLGGGAYTDDYGDPRNGGRKHEGTDVMGKKMQPLLAATDGVISYLTETEASWGYALTLRDNDGYSYHYLHINNDTPGSDDGKGGYNNAFAPGIKRGSRVVAGQTIAFLGDSGNAETTAPHLHFEIRVASTDEPINPYPSLKQAKILYQAVSGTSVTTNNDDEPTPTPTRRPRTSPTPTPTPTQSSSSREFFPYEHFEGGANIASANLDSDSQHEIITGTAFGGGGRTIITVHDTDGTLQNKFFAYGDVFRGGVDVAAADVDGDGKAEIITAAGPGGGPHIKIFKPDGTLVSEFFAYASNFRGGVYVSAADVDGDGEVEIITGPGAGGGPHVRVFNKSGAVKNEWFAYGSGFTGGVDVAAFAKDGTGKGGYATAPGASGGPHVKVYDAAAKVTSEFMAYDGGFSYGVRIAAGNLIKATSAAEIITVPASGYKPHLKVFSATGSQLESEQSAGFESSWVGGYDTAVVGTDAYISSIGGRQTSVRRVSGL